MSTLAFDLGNVICPFDYKIAFARTGTRMEASGERVLQALFYEEFGSDYERGLLSTAEFYEKARSSFGFSLSLDDFKDIWSDIFSLNEGTVSLLRALKEKGHSLYMLSNICELHHEFLLKKFPGAFEHFNDLILSYQAGAIKPEKKIYDVLCERSANSPENIIYIDDRIDLIEASRKMGFKAVLFKDITQCERELSAYGVEW